MKGEWDPLRWLTSLVVLNFENMSYPKKKTPRTIPMHAGLLCHSESESEIFWLKQSFTTPSSLNSQVFIF